MNIIKKAFLILIILLSGCTSPTRVTQDIQATAGHPVFEMEKVTLGGVDQWISVRGKSSLLPVLLFLHGGPGVPEMPLVWDYNSELVKNFIVVVWDQRGAGKSYSSEIPPASMTVDRFVSDTEELVEILKKKYKKEKIFLMGQSWGSALGMLVLGRHPENYYAYIGIGQHVNGIENERLSYEYTLSSAKNLNNHDAVKALQKIGPPVNGIFRNWFNGLKVHRMWLVQLGGILYGKSDYNEQMSRYMFSGDYSVIDKINLFRGLIFSIKYMWPQVVKIDLISQVPKVAVPVYFFTGRHDYNAPFELVEKYCSVLEAPSKEIVWFDKSGHCPNFEEPERFNSLVVEKFLPYVTPLNGIPGNIPDK